MEIDSKKRFIEKRKKQLEEFKQGNVNAIEQVSKIIVKVSTKYGTLFGNAFHMSVEDLTSDAYIAGFEFLQKYDTDSLTNISYVISRLERKIHLHLRKIVSEYYEISKKNADIYLFIYNSIHNSKLENQYILNFTKEQLFIFRRVNEIILTKFQPHNNNTPGLVIDEDEQFESIDFKLLRPIILKVLETLETREQDVLILRFGFSGYCMQNKDVASLMNVSPSRILQIEAKALRKLRHPIRLRLLIY